jgi:Sulfotransferase family
MHEPPGMRTWHSKLLVGLGILGLVLMGRYRIGEDALLATANYQPQHRPGKGVSSLHDHWIVVPEHKLLFCFVEKVACESFNQLFASLRSRYDPTQVQGGIWRKNTPQVCTHIH